MSLETRGHLAGGRRLSGPARSVFCVLIPVALLAPSGDGAPRAAEAGRVLHVTPTGQGDGSTPSSPLASLQDALSQAMPGDIVLLADGMYEQRLTTVRAGTPESPITLKPAEGAKPIVTSSGRVLSIAHPDVHVEGLVVDGQYGADDTIRIGSGAHRTQLRRMEVRRSARDCVDIGSAEDVLITGGRVHHCLNPSGGRSDAHGIVGAAARRLTIRDTEIHTFSGDGVQLDPSRTAPGWDELTVDRCAIWLAPLPAAENGFAAGTVPGENAIDTKTYAGGGRSRLQVSNSVFYGFRGGLITNMAAFNLKERVDAIVDRVTLSNSEIAFRLRGPADNGARVRISNAVVHDVSTAFRYEDDIKDLRIWHATIGTGVGRAFQRASASASVLDVRNLLLLGTQLPPEATGPSNMVAAASAFTDPARHDYRLREGTPAVDGGTSIADVTTDRDGRQRPQGRASDIGAYEWCRGDCTASRPPDGVRRRIK